MAPQSSGGDQGRGQLETQKLTVTKAQYQAIKLFATLGYELPPRAFAERMWPEACLRYSNVGSQGSATGQGAQMRAGRWLKEMADRGLLKSRRLMGSTIYYPRSEVLRKFREGHVEAK